MTRRYTGGFISATEQATDANTANGIYTLSDAAAATAAGNFPVGRWTPPRSLRLRGAASAYLNRTMSLSSPPAAVGGSLSTVYNFTISADTNSYSLQSEALKAGWDGKAAATFNLTIAAGVVVGSGSSFHPALDLTGFPTGVAINVTVGTGAQVVGAGGAGGAGGASWGVNGAAGAAGGDAIWASVPVTIVNNGTIAGGGGGGGGGGGSAPNGNYGTPGGSGGGGAGRIVGAGAGPLTATAGYTSAASGAGTLTTGGTGTSSPGQGGGLGGNGGNLGAAGTAGQNGQTAWNGTTALGGAAGAAGFYAKGNTHITWSTAGTRLGQVQSAVSSFISMTTFTYSTWVKRGSMALADDQWFFGSGNFNTSANEATLFEIQYKGAASGIADKLSVVLESLNAAYGLQTTAVYRDPSAWYHIVTAVDTNQSVSSERVKVYVNGDRVTSFSSAVYPPQGIGVKFDTVSIGSLLLNASPTRFFDGYLAEPHLVDGLQLPASSFGMTDPITGTWVPKYYNTIGPKGFYLDFANASSVSNLCLDRSGSANNFTGNNVSVTAGTTYDAMVDVPGIASVPGTADVGGVVRGNYCNWNILHKGSNPYVTVSEGNLKVVGNTATNSGMVLGTMSFTSGKYYWEITATVVSSDVIGIATRDPGTFPDSYFNNTESNTANFGYGLRYNGSIYGISGELLQGSGFSYTTNDIIGVAVDADNGALYFSKNGVWQFSGNPLSGAAKTGAFAVWPVGPNRPVTPFQGGYNTGTTVANFGQRTFNSTPPVGYKTLNTTNLPNPVIKRPSEHFDIKTYTGNGSSINVGTTAKESSAYAINKSLRFRSANSNGLTRTPTITGNRTTWTFSTWFKPTGASSVNRCIFSSRNPSGDDSYLTVYAYDTGNTIMLDFGPDANRTYWNSTTGGTGGISDFSWKHLVIAVDTTQTAFYERVKVYLNGSRLYMAVSTGSGSGNQPQLNQNTTMNTANAPMIIGYRYGYDRPFDGYIAETHMVDGQALTPTSFGNFDANNNWMPSRYIGTYGTNGFYLPYTAPSLGVTTYGGTFSGSNHLSLPSNDAFAFGTGDYTVEAWVNSSSTAQQVVFGTGATGTNNFFLSFDPDSYLGVGTQSVFVLQGAVQLASNTWYHIAASRSSGTLRLFVNGNIVASGADSTTWIQGGNPCIGNNAGGSQFVSGSISNLRVVKGTALYTSNFTPATTNLTAVSGTSLLTLQNESFVDNSTNAFTITNNSNVRSSFEYPFAVSPTWATQFVDGSGDYQTVPASSAFQFGTGDFTIEFWAWLEPYPGGGTYWATIFDACVGASDSNSVTGTVGIWQGDGTGTSSVAGEYTVIISGSSANQARLHSGVTGYYRWSHVALTRSSGTFTLWQDGLARNSATVTANINRNDSQVIGKSTQVGIKGFISNLRVVKGVAVYTGTFTPPTTPLTATQSAGTNIAAITAGQCSLLTAKSPTFTDESSNNFTITNFGNTNSTPYAIPPTNSGVGRDNSGNNNHWGIRGIDQISGTISYESALDSPADSVDSNSNSIGSYPTMMSSTATISNGGLRVVTASGESAAASTLSMTTGKWYFEAACTGNVTTGSAVGILQSQTFTSANNMYEGSNRGYGYYGGGSPGVYTNFPGSTAQAPYGASWTTGDTIGCAFDADNGTLQFFKNGISQGVYSGVITNREYRFAVGEGEGSATASFNVNFGQLPFEYTPPAGFRSLNTKNLKDVGSFNLPDSFGNFVSTPDLVWIKNRNTTLSHNIYDTFRGPRQRIQTNLTNAQTTVDGVISFVPNGIQLGNGTDDVNFTAGNTYVSWMWNRGKTPGFDIVNYTGTGANQTIPHNLGAVPKFMIFKSMSSISHWTVYHENMNNGTGNPTFGYINLNLLGGFNLETEGSSRTRWWNDKRPTPSEFYIGAGTSDQLNVVNQGWVGYLWAEVPGFSKFGSYTGNGSTDGTFVYTGFRPRYIISKRTDASSTQWNIWDTARSNFNPMRINSWADSNEAEVESDGYAIDALSNGFKLRNTHSYRNASGGTYIYAAFAEAPSKYATAR
jgi:hypothetical protein